MSKQTQFRAFTGLPECFVLLQNYGIMRWVGLARCFCIALGDGIPACGMVPPLRDS